MLLFVPFGVFGFLAVSRRRRSPFGSVLWVTTLAALLGAAVETLQLLALDRTTSVSDLAANTAGACGGALATHIVWGGFRRILDRLRALGLVDVPAFYPMMIATVLVGVAAWEPFDFTLDVGSVATKVRAWRADPWQFTGINDEGVEFVRYALLGLVLSSWLAQLRVRRARALGLFAGAAAACGLEASQWVIQSRMPSLVDAMVHTGGVIAGAMISWKWREGRSPVFWCVLLALATFAGRRCRC